MTTASSDEFTVLFIGDSVTDASRGSDPAGLGDGYVRRISEELANIAPTVRVVNRGVGGDRSRDVLARLTTDCLEEAPDLVSVLVGVNDVWRRFDRDDPTSVERFTADCREILTQIRDQTDARIVVCEPFVIPIDYAQRGFRDDLEPKIAALHNLATEFGARVVNLDSLLHRHAGVVGAAAVARDGVHPTAYGHSVIADVWLRAVACDLPLVEASWTLSRFGDEINDDPRVQVAVLTALGASAIEVRSAWGTNVIDLTAAQLGELAREISDGGLTVSAIASPIGKVAVEHRDQERARLAVAIAAAKRLGTDSIRIFSFYPTDPERPDLDHREVVEGLRALAKMAEHAGIVLLHENEKCTYGDVPERILRLVAEVDSPAFQLAWDSANYVQVGIVPDGAMIELVSPWLRYLQVKDASLHDGAVRPAGEGDGGLHLVARMLLKRGYRGVASLEPHLSSAFETGGFSGPAAFGLAASALRRVVDQQCVELR
ncbi:TIM barrel protein [Microbacterium sp. NPDC058389]|uniref:TIM barrel protein n=1 Tax=Microbacterium sp. NPDC058389 TaxID=3346475 RepID=UPI0036523692